MASGGISENKHYSRTMQDSGVGSFGSESDTSPVQMQGPAGAMLSRLTSQASQGSESGVEGGTRTTFQILYMGQSILDRHYTQPMLPWILSEVRRRREQRAITLDILPFIVRGTDTVSKKLIFEHQLKSLSRFARPQQDLSVFAYLTRPNKESPFSCHVFKVSDQSLVSGLHAYVLVRYFKLQFLNAIMLYFYFLNYTFYMQ